MLIDNAKFMERKRQISEVLVDSRWWAHNKQHGMAECNIQPAPSALKQACGSILASMTLKGKRTWTRPSPYETKLKYFGDTTNMRNHIKCSYAEEEEKQSVVVASDQRTIEQTTSNFPPNLERMRQITISIATSIAEDL